MPNFVITTLGCKVNQYESDAIHQRLIESGWQPENKNQQVDLCIINTCTVTQKAAMQSRQAIRQAIRSNPGAQIIVTGCYAQTESEKIKKIEGVSEIVSHADQHKISDKVQLFSGHARHLNQIPRHNTGHADLFLQNPVTAFGKRTRPFLKIQDGCNAFCTYCIVPYARGRSRSMPVETVFNYINRLKAAGYHEVVLTGVHLGCYGHDLSPETNLFALLNRIQASKPIDRVRLSSIEPCELTEDIIKLVTASDTFCRHFHIPLQSGDDRILQKMHRPYTRTLFKDLVFKIYEFSPETAIGVDVLIGFPDETDAAFENTYALIQQLPVAYLHVFPFSARKGTPANDYPAKTPSKVIKQRCRRMRALGNLKKREFYHKFLGTDLELLIEGKGQSYGLLKGMTSNYLPVLVRGNEGLKNTLIKARIREISENNTVFGTLGP